MMPIKPFSTLKKLALALTASLSLTACGQTTNLHQAEFTPQLSKLSLQDDTPIRQFAINEQGVLYVLSQTGELWQHTQGKWQALGQAFSPDVALTAKHGKIALADAAGRLVLFVDGKPIYTDIVLATHAQMLALPFAMIVVVADGQLTHLARINHQGQIEHIRRDFTVLSDTTPIQIELTGNDGGHIAVLAKPDNQTYRHGVLGDDIEAGEIRYLERHSLQDLLSPLSLTGKVFEANRLNIWQKDGTNYLISTPAGAGFGASTAVIGQQDGKLAVMAMSEPLPSNRWQSPFVFDGKLYAVQMPHLKRHLVRYDWQDDKLIAHTIGNQVSNHKIGDRNTDLSAQTARHALLPTADYQGLAMLQKDRLMTIHRFDEQIAQIQSHQNDFYVLLDDGTLWQLTIK